MAAGKEIRGKINQTGGWNDEIEGAFKQGISDFKTTGSW